MRRRSVLGGAAGALSLWPAVGVSDSRRRALIGWLGIAGDAETREAIAHFVQGMAALRRLRDGDYDIEVRSTGGANQKLPVVARDLVGLRPDLVIAEGARGVLAAAEATRDIPIIGPTLGENVVSAMIGPTFAHPSGNVTGLTVARDGGFAKLVEICLQFKPSTQRLGVLIDTALAAYHDTAVVRSRSAFGLEVVTAQVDAPPEIPRAVERLHAARADFVIVPTSATFRVEHARIVEAVGRMRMPAVYGSLLAVKAGGLAGFGIDPGANYRRAAFFADRLIEGVPVRDLPVEQAEPKLALNLKAAATFGFAIPPSLLARADEVIE